MRRDPTPLNGLQLPSQAMFDHFQSVRIERVGRVIGQLGEADVEAISRAVAAYLGFGDPPGASQTMPASRERRRSRTVR